MTTWWLHSTFLNLRFDRRLAIRVLCMLLLCIALITTLFLSPISRAAPGVNQTIGFQGRLLDVNGDIVPNGYYNIQFKIYQGGAGDAASNPGGALKWTETYTNNGNPTGAVEVKNGFLSVNLGSLNPFGASVDWNQDTLWLSMNVAGASTSCSTFGSGACAADGEMLPMKRMTATPYALNSAQLGGIDASGYIKSSTTAQNADITINGSARASTIQGDTSVLAPRIDAINAGDTLNIGTVDAQTINIGKATSANSAINIGTGLGDRTLVMGSTDGSSSTTIQGGGGGVRINTWASGGFVVHDMGNNYNPLMIANGSTDFNLGASAYFRVNNINTGEAILDTAANGLIRTGASSSFVARGSATFEQGITIQGTGTLKYTTPNGYQMQTAINIPNYTVAAYNSIIAFGLPSTSAATARGLLVADARTSNHQATIGVLSPDESAIMGFSWNGSTTTGYVSNTANTLALQGNGLNLLTATNNNGSANVGIGNAASSGHALDVTGNINTSGQYSINGTAALSNSSLNFSAASTASITSASGQLLNIDGKNGVNIQNNGTTVATFGNTNIQIGNGTDTGTPTLLTIDKATTAPTGLSSTLLGSMYYDTTVGKVMCYEADGWGACGSSPDTFITLSPQYANSVQNGAGVGTMTADFCSDFLNVNDGSSSQPTICGVNETNNYYRWLATSTTAPQVKSIYVTYQLPSNFKNFVAGSTSLTGRTDNALASVNYQTYKNTSAGLTACGAAVAVSTGAQTLWQKGTATGTADPANCTFAAGNSVVFKIDLSSRNSFNAYAGNLNLAYSSN